MSWTELKTFRLRCDACRKLGPTIHVYISPEATDVPEDWGFRTLGDCGLTGYTRHEILCPECLSLWDKREDGKARANA